MSARGFTGACLRVGILKRASVEPYRAQLRVLSPNRNCSNRSLLGAFEDSFGASEALLEYQDGVDGRDQQHDKKGVTHGNERRRQRCDDLRGREGVGLGREKREREGGMA